MDGGKRLSTLSYVTRAVFRPSTVYHRLPRSLPAGALADSLGHQHRSWPVVRLKKHFEERLIRALERPYQPLDRASGQAYKHTDAAAGMTAAAPAPITQEEHQPRAYHGPLRATDARDEQPRSSFGESSFWPAMA